MKKLYNKILVILLATIITQILTSCLSYSFTGGSVPLNVTTVTVYNIENRAPLIEPNLDFKFTEALKDIISGNTALNMVDAKGDVIFSGHITKYDITPIAITSSGAQGGQAQQNRLTVAMTIEYVDTKNETNSFTQEFSAYEDFAASQSLISVKDALIENIIKTITQNIYNRAFANW
ncbi:MAG: LPS assembly lipoprotein LptE [Solitalea-like symbiont of Acarus siro]